MKHSHLPADSEQKKNGDPQADTASSDNATSRQTTHPYSFQAAVDHSPRVVAQAMFADQGSVPSYLRAPAPVQGQVQVEVTPQREKLDSQEVVQALAVQIIPPEDDRNVVGEISINGRPERAFAGSMGDHTTAFIVHVSGLRLALEGQTYPVALRRLTTLTNTLGRLPGANLVRALDPVRKQALKDSKTALQAALLGAPHAIQHQQQPPSLLLQHLINLYLEFRELIPLSGINTKAKSPALAGKGKGESGHAATLRGHETGEAKAQSQSELQKAIWGLFDASSTAMMAVEANPKQAYEMAPGAQALRDTNTRMTAVWKQHLMSIEMSFPKAFADSKIGSGTLQTLKKHTQQAAKADLQAYHADFRSRLEEAARSWAELGPKSFTPEPGRFKSGKKAGQLTFVRGQKQFLLHSLNIYKNIQICREDLIMIQKLERVIENDSMSKNLEPKLKKFLTDKKIQYILNDAKMKVFTSNPKAVFDLTNSPKQIPESKSDEKMSSSSAASFTSQSSSTGGAQHPGMDNLDAELPSHFNYFDQLEEEEVAEEESKSSSAVKDVVMRPTPGIRSLGIQLRFRGGRISKISSEGRPPSPFKGTMGAHTTSWIVHLDHIRRNILGKTVQESFTALDNRVVPFVLKYIYAPNSGDGTKGHQSYAKEAKNDVLEVRNTTDKHQKPFPELWLQEYIRKILRFINYIPNVTRKKNDTSGHGEGVHRQLLLAYEKASSAERLTFSHKKLYSAVFGLFDGGGGNDRMRAAHQRIIAHTYPAVYAALKKAPSSSSSSSS